MRASELAATLGGRLLGEDCVLTGVAPLKRAGVGDISCIIWPQDIRSAKKTSASLLITTIDRAADYADELSCSIVVVEDFGAVFYVLKRLIAAGRLAHLPPTQKQIGKSSIVDIRAVIEEGAVIGEHCVIGPGVVIHSNVIIGNNCAIKANSVIGSEAFVPWGIDLTCNLTSLGSVILEEGVGIGALCSVDRGLIGATIIKAHAMLDNMVHVGHDVEIGKNVVIAAQAGLAGFVQVDDMATLGGQVGVVPFVHIGAHARISGKSLVHCDVKPYEIWSGNPSVPHSIYLRAYGHMKRMFKGTT